jgi:hypothetical protein
LYQVGSISSVAAHYEVSRALVRRWLRDLGIAQKSHQVLRQQQTMVPKIPAEAVARLADADWLTHVRVVEQWSLAQIARHLGFVTTAPVERALALHNIPPVDGRRRNTTATRCLEDYQWMYEHYVVQNHTMQEIADLLNSSKATVQRFVEFHGIEPTPSNQYPRIQLSVSSPVQAIVSHISSYYDGPILLNDRSVCRGLELDILLPEKHLAIEYHGIYHHLYRPEATTFSTQKNARYHLVKTEYCVENSIQLLQFYSDEYRESPDLIHSIIRSKLGCVDRRVGARQCEIRDIDTHTKNQFLQTHHLQGEDRSRHKYGMFFQDELVSVMTFTKSRFSTVEWELSRFAVKGGVSLPGGFSRFVKHFRTRHSGPIVSYADRRYSNGEVYRQNGFVLTRVNRPSYYYVKRGTEVRLHRMHLQKPRGETRTELEWASSLGYDRIYDCGTLTFVLE